MSSCYCNCYTIRRPRMVHGKHVYFRHPNPMPQSGWHGRHTKPSIFSYKSDGSYAGRNRPKACWTLSH